MSLRKKLRLDTDSENQEFDESAQSIYFINQALVEPQNPSYVAEKLLQIELDLVSKLNTINFPKPVDCIYSPIEYAFDMHSNFVKTYCNSTKKVLFLGINPGPWGMSQTGIPFGEVNFVRDWLKITGIVQKPVRELPARPIQGLNCTRSELSGKRFWGLFKNICGTPENFFKNSYLHNFCPIALMKDSGTNITPNELKEPVSKAELFKYCDDSLVEVIDLLQAEKIVAIGRCVEKQVKSIFKRSNISNIELIYLKHPSPRSIHNENWPEEASTTIEDFDLLKSFQ